MLGVLEPAREALKLPPREGNKADSAMPSAASACNTRAAAWAISRFSFCAVASSGASSSAPNSAHQSAFGQAGAVLSMGAVKPGGTSPGRFKACGLAVQAARLTASMLAVKPRREAPRRKAPRIKDFIELSLPKMGRPCAAENRSSSQRPTYPHPAPLRKYGGRRAGGKPP